MWDEIILVEGRGGGIRNRESHYILRQEIYGLGSEKLMM